MKMKPPVSMFTSLLACFALAALTALAIAAPMPRTISYQGYLKNANGAPASSPQNVTFHLYSSRTVTPTPLWSELHNNVPLTNGVYSVQLGETNPFSNAPAMQFHVGVQVGSGLVLMPLQPMSSVPFALYAFDAGSVTDGSVTATKLATGSVTADKLDTAYVKRSGDIMSGLLTLPANGLIVGANQLVVNGNKVSIGTAELELAGNLRLPATSATAGIIKQGTTPIIHSFGSLNFFAGANAGNLTMGGHSNTAVGVSALAGNSSGFWNTATGMSALSANTSGTSNTAQGAGALQLNTTGNQNTAGGTSALYGNKLGSDNTAYGYYALRENTTARKNTAVGSGALQSQSFSNVNTPWDTFNTAVGYHALFANQPEEATVSGRDNTAVGASALAANTSGGYNTAGGSNTLAANTTGIFNTAVGSDALTANTTGGENTAYGYSALAGNTTGTYNTASGSNALAANTTGVENAAYGYNVLRMNSTGQANTAIGSSALYYNTTASRNTAIGAFTLVNQHYSSTNVSWYPKNTAVGFGALNANNPTSDANGINNTAVGDSSLAANTTGWNNTALGVGALSANTTGLSNTAVGSHADVAAVNLTNAAAFGFQAKVDASNKVRIGNGNVTVIEGQVGWSYPSDIRLKQDITDVSQGLDFIRRLRPVEFRMKTGNGRKDFGFIAQDIEALLGTEYNVLGVGGGEDRPLTLRYTDFIAPMVKAIQEQQTVIEEQRGEIKTLKERLAHIEALLTGK